MKVVQVGCGKMSVYTMRYVMDRGGELVGAYDVSPGIIGKDIGEITGRGPTGVRVEDIRDLDASLKRAKPDIAVITTRSLIAPSSRSWRYWRRTTSTRCPSARNCSAWDPTPVSRRS